VRTTLPTHAESPSENVGRASSRLPACRFKGRPRPVILAAGCRPNRQTRCLPHIFRQALSLRGFRPSNRLDKLAQIVHILGRVLPRFYDTITLLLPLAMVTAAVSAQEFDGNRTEIFWHNEAKGESAVWFLNQKRFLTAGRTPNDMPAGWRIAATADFNRDGHPDFLWRSPSTRKNEIWLMNGPDRISRHPLPASEPGWDIAGTGDFNGDGYPDIIWREPESNYTVAWLLDGPNWNGSFGWISLNQNPFTWNLAATGDFNNDGYTDIIWRDRYSGENVMWLMNGMELLKSIDLQPQPDLGYELAGTGSFNIAGKTDLLWRTVNGDNTIWLMSGPQRLGSATLPFEIDNNWRICGTRGNTNGMLLSAIPNEKPGTLTLVWRYGLNLAPAIERRELGKTSWDLLATNYLPARFTNSDLTIGKRYEYRVGGEYLLTGIAATPVEDRGKIILVVENSLADKIESDLELLKSDLVGDGWSLIRTNVPRHDDATWSKNVAAIASIKSFITNAYYQDPAGIKAVYLIGHVPIPYGGFSGPDGHGSRALPADIFYGDMDGIYTDRLWNFPSQSMPRLARHDNFSDDGKFDQSHIPANAAGVTELELAVGRIDFSELPSFGAFTEAELTQRYIRKAHRYRHKEFELPNRVSVATFFPFGTTRESYSQALKISSRLFGNDPSYINDADPFDRPNASLWGILGGNGVSYGIANNRGVYHHSGQMPHVETEPKLAFANVCGSYVLDFHYPDNFMRAFLATPTYGLAIMWFRPFTPDWIPLAFEPLGLGETLGTGFVRSINESQYGTGENIFINLLGDPTLRLQVLAPPRALAKSTKSNVTIEWVPSVETNATYLVYRSTRGLDGSWIRLTPNPISEASFADSSAPPGPKMYQVRAAKLSTTGSGSYTNLSQGIFLQMP
jgi:hypothetical protein